MENELNLYIWNNIVYEPPLADLNGQVKDPRISNTCIAVFAHSLEAAREMAEKLVWQQKLDPTGFSASMQRSMYWKVMQSEPATVRPGSDNFLMIIHAGTLTTKRDE